jgi:hypothetical protein
MLTLNDGRSELWQWDTGRKLTVDADCTQVHFSNKFFGRSVDVDVFDGTAEIPDVLLQADKDLLVWAFVGTAENGYTKISKVFKVNKRNKPADYVFTPTDQTTLEEILDRIKKLEENPDVDVDLSGVVKSVNGITPDENGNVDIDVPESGGNVDLTGYVRSVNGVIPDENGNVIIAASGSGSYGFDLKLIGKLIASGGFGRIILLGDSITDGYGGTGYNGSQSGVKSTNTDGYCWANVFKKYITERYGIPVENYGYYGTGASHQYNQIKNVVGTNDLVIWLSGTNNRISGATFSEYESNIASYVNDIKNKVAALVFMPCVPSTDADEKSRFKTTQDMNEVAFKYVFGNTYYLDMYSKYIEYCEKQGMTISDTMYDALHPNDIGYLHMFMILCRELGLPLYFYSDFSNGGDWWGGDSETVMFSVSNNLSNVATNNAASSVLANSSYSARLTAITGYKLESVVVTMGGVNITATAYSDGEIYISAVTGNVVVTALASVEEVAPTEYTVTNSLSNVSTNNNQITVSANGNYTAILTAYDGYELKSVVVMMGGANVTDAVYADGVINIPTVTGNVVITATANEVNYWLYPDHVASSNSKMATANSFIIDYPVPVGTITKVKLWAAKSGTFYFYLARRGESSVTVTHAVPLTVTQGLNTVETNIAVTEESYKIATGDQSYYLFPANDKEIPAMQLGSRPNTPLNVGDTIALTATPARDVYIGICPWIIG